MPPVPALILLIASLVTLLPVLLWRTAGFKVVVSQADDEDDSLYCPTCLELYTEDNPKT